MGLLNLISLSYLAVISAVLFLYFYNKRSNVIYVSSMIPWKELSSEIASSRSPRFNMLFFLQILLIILMALFLARPYMFADISIMRGNNNIVVIDSSASMQTIEKDGARFEQAKNYTLNIVDEMSSADKMMIISAYSSAQTIIELTEDKEALRKKINELQPTDTGSDIEGGISLALSYMAKAQDSRLYVLTDHGVNEYRHMIEGIDPKSALSKTFAESFSNVAISSFDIFQDMFSKNDEAYVTLKNYDAKPKKVKLTVSLQQKTALAKDLNLKSYEQKTVTVRSLPSSGILKARIETDDNLKVDNTAYGIVKKRKKRIEALLVTDSVKFKTEFQKLEQAFPQLKISTIPSGAYNEKVLTDFDICIYHQFVPLKQPDINSFFIAPEFAEKANINKLGTGNSVGNNGAPAFWAAFLEPKGVIENVHILDWDNSHPTMKYLDYIDNIKNRDAMLFTPPEGSKILIYAAGNVLFGQEGARGQSARNNLPLAFANMLGNKKSITMSLDLGDFDYSDSNNLPALIMTLNMIQWLSPLGESQGLHGGEGLPFNELHKTGALFYINNHNNFKGLSVVKNDGTVRDILDDEFQTPNPASAKENDIQTDRDNESQNTGYTIIKHAGVYTIKRKDKDEIFTANMFNDNESNLTMQKERLTKSIQDESNTNHLTDKSAVTSKREITELSRFILYLIPIFLFIEWLYSFVKQRFAQ